MANTCGIGFCVNGAGPSLVNAGTRAVVPKLMQDQIGFEPGAEIGVQ